MTTHASRTLEDVFGLLGRWRHLPYYRLEPRADPFFALFLRDILESCLDVDLHRVVIPEFPLRLGTLTCHGGLRQEVRSAKATDDQSVKVDYAAFSRDSRRAFLVELKTDNASVDKEQERCLRAARRAEFHHLVAGIVHMAGASGQKQKYVHLLHLLSEIDLLTVGDELYDRSFRKPGSGPAGVVRGWTKALEAARDTVERRDVQTDVVYIKPTEQGSEKTGDFRYIYFKEVAATIRQHGELGRMFAEALSAWQTKAGSEDPRRAIAAA